MKITTITLAISVLALPALAQSSHLEPAFKDFNDLKWERTNPELGDGSPEISILHVNPITKATELIIRTPKDYHVGRHWHSFNETITVIRGTFVVGHDGSEQKVALTPGSYAYMPAKMVHDAWTKDDGATYFITVDGPFDINWVK
ncbi:MAG TPA: cupin domain-containing protein [Pseudomonas sp.]|jgi:quercetin dioxygenase-like cupin family protein|nr:cupin domain-containing protein [Pseudomonas sp.]